MILSCFVTDKMTPEMFFLFRSLAHFVGSPENFMRKQEDLHLGPQAGEDRGCDRGVGLTEWLGAAGC